MTADTQRVDVLAILDALIAEYELQGEVVEARNTIAELIEAADALTDYLDSYLAWQHDQGDDGIGLAIAESDVARFRDYIARIGSAP